MFCYVCVAPATIPQRNEVELNGKDLRGKGPCLVGPSPTIILRPNQVVLAAKQRADATAWKLSFAAGDALLMALQAGDEIYMTRGGTGDFDLYVERLGRRGFPGQAECVAISRKDAMGLKIAAMRSAILLANSGQHIVKWEFFGDSSYGR